MRIFIINILMFWVFASMAQSTDTNKTSRFSFGVSFSPDYSYRKTIENPFDDTESARLGYTTGLSVKYILVRRFALESGLLFADKGNKVEMREDDWVSPDELLDPGFSGIDPALPSWMKTKYHYYYLEFL